MSAMLLRVRVYVAAPAPEESHEIAEHIQVRPISWRWRGPQDDD
jgi:hypothetical protein